MSRHTILYSDPVSTTITRGHCHPSNTGGGATTVTPWVNWDGVEGPCISYEEIDLRQEFTPRSSEL